MTRNLLAPHTAFLPKGARPTARALELKKKRVRMRWKHRHEETKPPYPKIKRKMVFRIQAEDPKGILRYLKIRTKNPLTNIKRILSRSNLRERRITI